MNGLSVAGFWPNAFQRGLEAASPVGWRERIPLTVGIFAIVDVWDAL